MEMGEMNDKNFITCSHCLRELQPTIQHEIENAMVSNYHCEQCCYSFSIYSITKTKLAEIQQGFTPEEEYEPMEHHELMDK
jgi:hypothetical protein